MKGGRAVVDQDNGAVPDFLCRGPADGLLQFKIFGNAFVVGGQFAAVVNQAAAEGAYQGALAAERFQVAPDGDGRDLHGGGELIHLPFLLDGPQPLENPLLSYMWFHADRNNQ